MSQKNNSEINNRSFWKPEENKCEMIPVPEGYVVNDDGVAIQRYSTTGKVTSDIICYTPVGISSIGMDIDRGEFWYEITFKDVLGQLKTLKTTQENLIRRSNVCKFANQGLNLVDKKAVDLCKYFNESIDQCAKELPYKTLVQTNGWKNDQTSFVLGNRNYTGSGVSEVIQINQEETKGLVKKGNLEQWVCGVSGVICEPITRFKCYCAVTSILLRPLNAQSFFVDHTGDTSTGKTFGVRIAVSMYGDPESLKLSGNSTVTYLEDAANKFTDLPLFVDETSTQTDEILKTLIYIITNEVEKGRGNKDGGVRKVNHWKTVVFTTGEKPIVDYDGFGGQQVRVLEIQEDMPPMQNQIVQADETIKDNYGHVIDLFIKKVFEYQEELQSKFRIYREKFTNSNSKTANRVGNTFATIALAGELLEEVFDEIGLEKQNNLALTMRFFNKTVMDKPVVPRELKALRILNDWIEENRNYFVKDGEIGEGTTKVCGYLQGDYIDIIPNMAKNALKTHGFDLSTIRDKLIKQGVLVTYSDGRDYKPTYHDRNGNPIRNTYCRINFIKMMEILENGI